MGQKRRLKPVLVDTDNIVSDFQIIHGDGQILVQEVLLLCGRGRLWNPQEIVRSVRDTVIRNTDR
jgi:hypothetical protein